MIELTPQQRQELVYPETIVVNPETNETYVLVRLSHFLKQFASGPGSENPSGDSIQTIDLRQETQAGVLSPPD